MDEHHRWAFNQAISIEGQLWLGGGGNPTKEFHGTGPGIPKSMHVIALIHGWEEIKGTTTFLLRLI